MPYCKRFDSGDKLRSFDTKEDGGLTKEEGLIKTNELAARLGELQELMFAAGSNPLLIVLQGRDTSGKDGTIRHLLQHMNAQSTRIAPFKVPTPVELAHDFLWRVHLQTPMKGETVIFNRSHYEDVLVVRVHNLVPEAVWSKRYETINEFEELLTESGTLIVKFFLNISKDEQEERLLEREQDPKKAWKLSAGDWKERQYWQQYEEAYEDVLAKCSPKNAPWNVVAADSKWYRNLAVTEALVNALAPYEDAWRAKLDEIGEKAKAEIAAFREQP
ncbi:MAG TPA: PPK2 family polyphosphate kinase [Fimbriimonas sp.]|nr:PPK2 family polyphosphate kinase [Fimbriimonas sp.]